MHDTPVDDPLVDQQVPTPPLLACHGLLATSHLPRAGRARDVAVSCVKVTLFLCGLDCRGRGMCSVTVAPVLCEVPVYLSI